MKNIASRIGLGKAILYGYHRPIGLIRQSIAEGGPIEQMKTERGRLRMVEAARTLPTLAELPDLHGAKVNYLSGSKFWYQTLFCFVSLQQNSPFRITPIIHDDGTLDSKTQSAILRVVPWAVIIDAKTIEQKLDRLLPESRYPSLRARRREYPHLRKLTDLHDPHEWSLVLDSDMLFFRRPDAVLDWIEQPRDGLFIQDAVRFYGYSDSLMATLAHGPIPEQMNVGLYGLHGSQVDYDYIEHCIRVQLESEGASYLQEQALTALMFSKFPAMVLPREDYVVMPDLTEGRDPTAVMHHYVSHSNRSYFQHGWRLIASQAQKMRRMSTKEVE